MENQQQQPQPKPLFIPLSSEEEEEEDTISSGGSVKSYGSSRLEVPREELLSRVITPPITASSPITATTSQQSPATGQEMGAEECTICHRCYQETERRPRSLGCGHTLCSLCVAALIKEGTLTCPTCLTDHKATDATQFPVNYSLENMIARFKNLQADVIPSGTLGRTGGGGGARLGRTLQSAVNKQKEEMDALEGKMKEELNHLEQYRVRLSLSLAKHGIVLKKLDRVGQHHKKAMKVLMEEDLRTEAFMEVGETTRKKLKTSQDQLDLNSSLSSSQNSCFPDFNAGDENVGLVEDWLQHCKEKFPNGEAYNTSCMVLDNTEGLLQVALDCEENNNNNNNTAHSIPSGHPDATLMETLKLFHDRSARIAKLHIRNKLRKAFEEVLVKSEEEEKYFSFTRVTGNTSPPLIFKFGDINSNGGDPSSSPSQEDTPSPISRQRPRFDTARRPRRILLRKKTTQSSPTTSTTTTTTTTTSTTTTATITSPASKKKHT